MEIILSLPDPSRLSIVSYEKLLSDTTVTLGALFKWLGFRRDEFENIAIKAAEGITLNNPLYLKESNLIPRYAIDKFTRELISGWCFFDAAHFKKAVLVLEDDASTYFRIVCDGFRPNLVPLIPHGKCGFCLTGDMGLPAKFPEGFRLRLENTDHILNLPFAG